MHPTGVVVVAAEGVFPGWACSSGPAEEEFEIDGCGGAPIDAVVGDFEGSMMGMDVKM